MAPHMWVKSTRWEQSFHSKVVFQMIHKLFLSTDQMNERFTASYSDKAIASEYFARTGEVKRPPLIKSSRDGISNEKLIICHKPVRGLVA